MKGFIKIFFASFIALVVFVLVFILIGVFMIGKATSTDKVSISSNSILLIDLSVAYTDQSKDNTINSIFGDEPAVLPGLYDVVRMINYAKKDSSIKGIYIKAAYNNNGFAASEELRNAIQDFKQSKKFVIAYGEVISQKGYYVATVADKIYCHPKGGVEWSGFATNLFFLKGMLDKLEIEPQVIYAGKFKSATEPFRFTQMSDANRLQTSVWMNDLYGGFLQQTATARQSDTASLHALATNSTVRLAGDALKYHLVDGLKYDDELKSELFSLMHIKETDKPNFVTLGKYSQAVDFKSDNGDKIALIYAEGEIVDGKGDDGQIGSDNFKNLLRKARFDKDIKAIVLRVNSPGGSALASDVIWREVTMARKEKPVVVSMGDVAASGGYYISCNGDSIFADPGTITGSIGVFSLIPNMQGFFKNKLGITFDGVKTAPSADEGSIARPLTPLEKQLMQADVDSVYYTFKSRVAEGRKRSVEYIDSIAQGRVWTGSRAIEVGLVDKLGNLQDAIDCAARMGKITTYRLKEYPEHKSLLDQLRDGASTNTVKAKMMKDELGEEHYQLLQQMKSIKTWFNVPQARLPFEYTLN